MKTVATLLLLSGLLCGTGSISAATDTCEEGYAAIVLGGFDVAAVFDCDVLNDIRTEGSINVLNGGQANLIARFIGLGPGFSVNEGGRLSLDTSPGLSCGPAAFEIPGNGLDDDCDGMTDNSLGPCDNGLNIASANPQDAARALDLCQLTTALGTEWGLLDAQWVMPDGALPPVDPDYALGHGLLDNFGPNVNVQRGNHMLGLSSGAARRPGDVDYQSPGGFDKGYTGSHPPGFPKESPSCPGVVTGAPFDAAALEVTFRAPDNVNGFAFDYKFYTYEFPAYICSQYNDFFIALGYPAPPGASDNLLAFDSLGNPISVNAAFLEVCVPQQAGGVNFTCPLGTAELLGTGFGADTELEHHGATGWLSTWVPVVEGTEFTLRLATYDSGDGVLDSTALIDNFRWLAGPPVNLGTQPIPDPL